MTDFYKQISVVRQKWEEQAQAEIQCGHTTEEIEKSFIEDVEAVKEQLPNGDLISRTFGWQYIKNLNEINEVLNMTEEERSNIGLDGIRGINDLVSVTYDTNHGCYLAIWKCKSVLPSVAIPNKTGHCKDCKYFEYDSVAKVDGIPLIVAHEICSKWGDGCKTKEDGYCFLYEPQESEEE